MNETPADPADTASNADTCVLTIFLMIRNIERHYRQRYDPAMSDQSSDPRDKLKAVLNYDRPDPDDDLGVVYRDACGAWFGGWREGALTHPRRPVLYLAMNGDTSARTKGTANSSTTVTTMVADVRRAKLRNNIAASMFR
jgi:hypothetical protein